MYIVRRVLLALVTLWLLATIVFVIANVLPNNVGRTILGPFAPQETVDRLNHELGTDDPLIEQYGRQMKALVTFDYGDSYASKRPVWGIISGPLWRSAKLAAYALLMTVPISILAGMIAARKRDKAADRGIVLAGLALSSIPEFVTASILAVSFGVGLGWFPVLAQASEEHPSQWMYLFLPALAMSIVYFGYIARMMRASTIRALEADYTRTATMKGLSPGAVMRTHVLRNAMGPTISVISVQVGYLFGGIIGVEKVFNYNGLGQTVLIAAKGKDLPVLQACVIVIGVIYMISTLVADIVIAWLNPRARLELGT
jgi:peptide/nickel transport system permease protein